ncbi:MAG TPA: STAS domain-containing protein [Anaeromyxobacteraceae bacterium]|nr:STAS domain-containing protein [Anaeromyxobacteraceae bacterium]
MSALPARFAERDLVIEVQESGEEIRLVWSGKSIDREPGRFLMPIFNQLLERVRGDPKRIAIDFSRVEYMNSSTFAPLVKLLDAARRSGASVVLEYSPSRNWQTLSFTALRTFETPDGRIAVRAK